MAVSEPFMSALGIRGLSPTEYGQRNTEDYILHKTHIGTLAVLDRGIISLEAEAAVPARGCWVEGLFFAFWFSFTRDAR